MKPGFPYFLHSFIIALMLLVLSGCETMPSKDDALFRAHQPRSILILPPTNDSIEPDAHSIYLSTISRPVGERGYYVFPVAIVEAYMQENGVTDPYEMHQIPLDKLSQVFDADAVLKINIHDFGQKYILLSSNTVVSASATLIDLKTGQVFWEGDAYASEGSGDSGAGLAGLLVTAVIDQVVDSLSGRARDVAITANWNMIHFGSSGFLPGPYYPVEKADRNSTTLSE